MRLIPAIVFIMLLPACHRDDSHAGTISPASPAPSSPDTGQPSSSRPAITTDAERYSFEPGEHGAELEIRSTLHAPPNQTVYVVNCNGQIAAGLQSFQNDVWTDSWAGVINQCLSEPIIIPPGGSHDLTLLVRRGSGSMVDGEGDNPPPGTYRVIWYGALDSFDGSRYPFGNVLPVEQRVSEPIIID